MRPLLCALGELAMSELAKIKTRVNRLSTRDRADLAYYLLHSLDDEDDPIEVSQAWEKELDRRWSLIESGKEKGISAQRALSKLRERFS